MCQHFNPTVRQLVGFMLSQGRYEEGLRSAARGLWAGVLAPSEFKDTAALSIANGFESAWREGAGECGLEPEDRSDEETRALEGMIVSNIDALGGLRDWISEHSKSKEGKLDAVFTRLGPWANRYSEAANRAKAMACADQKFTWELGNTEKHCSSCKKLEGKVFRGSEWAAADVRPQHPKLECGGFNCDCSFKATNRRRSSGEVPRP